MTGFAPAGEDIQAAFFKALVQAVDSHADQQVSMYDVGDGLGLPRTDSQAIAQELMAAGVAEVRTLAGAIGLTDEGLAKATGMTGDSASSPDILKINPDPDGFVDREGCRTISTFQNRLAQALQKSDIQGNTWQTAITYLKIVDLCLTSPQPSWAVIRESYRSLRAAVQTKGSETQSPATLINLLDSALKGS